MNLDLSIILQNFFSYHLSWNVFFLLKINMIFDEIKRVNTIEIGIFYDGSLFYVPCREKVTIPKGNPFKTLRRSSTKNIIITWNAKAKSSGGTYDLGMVIVLASNSEQDISQSRLVILIDVDF